MNSEAPGLGSQLSVMYLRSDVHVCISVYSSDQCHSGLLRVEVDRNRVLCSMWGCTLQNHTLPVHTAHLAVGSE